MVTLRSSGANSFVGSRWGLSFEQANADADSKLITMAKKGFGKSIQPPRRTKNFMRLFMERVVEAKGNETKIQQFLKSNKENLDETLLDALPSVFATLTADQLPNKRKNIAALFGTFGNLVQNFPLGDRALNLELSLVAYHLVLDIYTRRAFPEDWATTQNNLGNAYCNRLRGERAENLEKAITAYELALQVYTCEAFPEKWAMTQNNLGTAYDDRWCSERAENLEKAIAAYELALQVYTREAFPEKWAMTQNNLGTAYSDRLRGERAENLEKAMTAYELALQVYTRKAFPEDWAMTQNNLGNTYGARLRGERAENLEKAITAYGLALQVRTRESFPEDWAATQNNLGTAYSDRLRGERAENLEKAIAAYELALQVYTREAFPEKWATAQNNLGNTYGARLRGERAENLEKAITTYELALQVRTRESFPQDWAATQNNLAGLLAQRTSLTDNFVDLDTAITLLKSALEVSASGSPTFINIQSSLGNALTHRYEHSQNLSDLEQSLQAYKTALDAISLEHYDRKEIWQALPTTQSILGGRLVRDGQWQEGLQLLLNSVNQLSTSDNPLAHANALFQTGRAHEILSDWDNARLYYRDALRLYEHLQDQTGIAQSSAGLGGVLVSQGHLEKGLAELAKAREHYHQLNQPDKAAEVENLCQATQKAMERQAIEAYV
jgi:tetratricopeptide (TPR) repeat protein